MHRLDRVRPVDPALQRCLQPLGARRQLFSAARPQMSVPSGRRNTALDDSGMLSIDTPVAAPDPRYKAAFVMDAPKSIAAITQTSPSHKGESDVSQAPPAHEPSMAFHRDFHSLALFLLAARRADQPRRKRVARLPPQVAWMSYRISTGYK
jgi:hypothetical protein